MVSTSKALRGRPASNARLSGAESEQALALIKAWMARLGVRSIDELSLSADNLKRSSLYRWFATRDQGREVKLRISAVCDIVDALRLRSDSKELVSDFALLLRAAEERADRESALIDECRKHGVSFQKMLAVVRGARHQIVPDEQRSQLS